MQALRHAGPVGLSRTLAQGVVGPTLAATVLSQPQRALAIQAGVFAYTVTRRFVSQCHSERNAIESNRAYNGYNGKTGSLERRLTQAMQTFGTTGFDVLSLILTGLSARHRDPGLQRMAAAFVDINMRALISATGRELACPIVNTTGIGNPRIDPPGFYSTLRTEDISAGTRLLYGACVSALEFCSQMGMQHVTSGLPLSQVRMGLAVSAAAIPASANVISSSIEDHLIATAAERRMQQEHDPSHVRHVFRPKLGNPLLPQELLRQLQRVDARITNHVVPAVIVGAIFEGLRRAFPSLEADPGEGVNVKAALVYAALSALVTGAILAYLLPRTAQTYQHNDMARSRNSRDTHFEPVQAPSGDLIGDEPQLRPV